MKIRLKPGAVIAGPDVVHVGRGVYELPDAQASGVIDAGHAEAVDAAPPRAETADAVRPAAAEIAALTSKGKRG